MEVSRSSKLLLNLSGKKLTKKQINNLQDMVSEKTLGLITDMKIIELPNNLKDNWIGANKDNYKDICDDIRKFMKKNDIHNVYLDGFIPAVIEISKWSYTFYYLCNDEWFWL